MTPVTETAASRLRQWVRYGTVSLIATVTSLTVLGVLVSTTTIPAGIANVIATAVGTVPSFELNRRWVWQRTGRRSMRAELVPFWILSFTGLALSTLTVTLAAAWADSAGLSGLTPHLLDPRSTGLTYEPFYGLKEKPFSLTPEELGAVVKSDYAKYGKIIRDGNIKIDN